MVDPRMSRSRSGRVRCALSFAAVPAAVCAVFGALGACNYIAYLGNYGPPADGSVEETGTPDAGTDASDAGVPCGPKVCTGSATCVNPQGGGTCSTDIVSVSAGFEGACALVANGTVWCWGTNQLGTAGAPPEGDDECTSNGLPTSCRYKPTQVAGLEDVIQLSAGTLSVCAVKRDNSVWCWGMNSHGQLGHYPGQEGDSLCPESRKDGGTPLHCNAVPTRVEGLAAVEVAAGRDHTCAIKKDGVVVCWGRNVSKVLGNRDIVDFTPIPQVVASLPPVVHLSVGVSSYHMCALAQEKGTVWCWGDDNYGQLGHPASLNEDCSGKCSAKAIQVTWSSGVGDAAVSEPFENVSLVRAAYLYTCAVRDGSTWCWGSPDFGTLGTGATGPGPYRSPLEIVGLPSVRDIDTRFQHACGLTENDRIYCWGANILGSVGTGDILGESCKAATACKKTPIDTGITGAVGVATGGATGYAIRDLHRVVSAWGDNSTARLGHAPKTDGDLRLCGDNRNSVCNPVPRPIAPFPPNP